MGRIDFDSNNFVEKKGRSKPFLKPILFILGLIILIVALYLVYSNLFVSTNEMLKCADGTFFETCSLDKPYFCNSNGRLIENISCGCSESFFLLNGTCVSKYDGGLEERYFNYTLDGILNQIYFKFRPKVLEKLEENKKTNFYQEGESPRRDDFKIPKIKDNLQREFLIPLIVEIENLAPNSKDLQAKIAASLVQNIPYSEPNFTSFFGNDVRLARYPYGVLGDMAGSCEGKSELLATIYDELGFGVAIFYFGQENHEAVGIKCPVKYSYKNSGFCFVETTVPSPISFSEGKYLGLGGNQNLMTDPEVILISEGFSLSEDLADYEDSDDLAEFVKSDGLNYFQEKKMNFLRKKYGLTY